MIYALRKRSEVLGSELDLFEGEVTMRTEAEDQMPSQFPVFSLLRTRPREGPPRRA